MTFIWSMAVSDYRLSTLSLLLAVLSAYASLDLLVRISGPRRMLKVVRVTCGFIALGAGVLAFQIALSGTITFVTMAKLDVIFTVIVLLELVYLGLALDRRLARSSAEMIQVRAQWQGVFDNLAEGVVVLDGDANILQMNPVAAGLLGLKSGSFYQQAIWHIFDYSLPSGERLTPERWPSSLARQGIFQSNSELIIRQKDSGTTMAVEVSTVGVRDKAGELSQLLMTYRNITESKLIEEPLPRLEVSIKPSAISAPVAAPDRGYQTADTVATVDLSHDGTEDVAIERQSQQVRNLEAIGRIIGGIAHDFNNVLGVIIGNLDLLERIVGNNESALKRVQSARKGLARGGEVVRTLRCFASGDGLRPMATSLSESIYSSLELERRVTGRGITFHLRLDETIPPVMVDSAGLESALSNLILNARDAMPGGGTLSITTELRHLEDDYIAVLNGDLKAGSYVSMSISDSGSGMSRKVMERAFDPFFSTKPKEKAMGLGLAMVYGFVKQSGGTARIYSEEGYGTTLSLYLPLVVQMEATPLRSDVTYGRRHTGGSVLVVDDESELLEVAVTYLSDFGYRVYPAVDGPSALNLLDGHSDIDLIVTDIIMPNGMSGVELAQKARQMNPTVRVVYCSGFPADALEEGSLTIVDGPLLHKPYQRAEFDEVVRRVMSN